MSELKSVFGIDLGTTYSCIAGIDETGRPVVLRNSSGDNVTPSIVYFGAGEVIVGRDAREMSRADATRVVEAVKRNMGNANWKLSQDGSEYRAEQISAFILRKVVQDAEARLAETGIEQKIRDVVITCPAYFGPGEREATKAAGALANLNVLSIINEPTAAAISYGLGAGAKSDDANANQTVMVYDLGGGTFDVTVITIRAGEIRVVATGGDRELGGKDWDAALVNHFAMEFEQSHGVPESILENPETLQDLWILAESLKRVLTTRDTASGRVTHDGMMAKVEVSRERFESLTADLLQRTIDRSWEMFGEAWMQLNRSTTPLPPHIRKPEAQKYLDKILLVGGSSRMPMVARRLKEEFGVETQMYDPDECVARGAALYGQRLNLEQEIQKAMQDAPGRSREDAVAEVAGGYGLPGATVAELTATKIINVASKSFGIIAMKGPDTEVVFNLICRNDPVPASSTQVFVTLQTGQIMVDVRLMENSLTSKEAQVSQSVQIGQAVFHLPPGLAQGAPLEFTLGLNEQGLVTVRGREPRSGRDFAFEVKTAGVMTQEEISECRATGLAMTVQ